jgi:hypothetical protein
MSLVRDAYLQEIKDKKEQIQKIVAKKFPQYPVEVRGGRDDSETVYVILYCVEKDVIHEVVDKLEDLFEDMAPIADYLMLMSLVKTPDCTQEYYPEIYKIWENMVQDK